MDGIERILDNFGLMTGDWAITYRLIIGGLLGGLIVTTLKPSIMFTEEGTPRPWNLLSSGNENATSVPWWLAIVAGAMALGVFI